MRVLAENASVEGLPLVPTMDLTKGLREQGIKSVSMESGTHGTLALGKNAYRPGTYCEGARLSLPGHLLPGSWAVFLLIYAACVG